VRRNYDLTLHRELQVNTTDTFATACFVLGIELPDGLDGKPIHQIIADYELLRDASTQPPATRPAETAPTMPATQPVAPDH
jgi:hypothetical protein